MRNFLQFLKGTQHHVCNQDKITYISGARVITCNRIFLHDVVDSNAECRSATGMVFVSLKQKKVFGSLQEIPMK